MVRPFAALFLSLTLSFAVYLPHDAGATEVNTPLPSPVATQTTDALPTGKIPEIPGEGGRLPAEEPTYDQTTIIQKATAFFGDATEEFAKAAENAFQKYGRPNAYIEGQEVAGAMTVGVCYGDGVLTSYNGSVRRVYWQGPSLGLDLGLNVSKVFILVYHLPDADAIFRRFPGVDGNLYYFAGLGVTYLENNGIVLAPIRLGVGFRTGASVSYLHITTAPSWNPF
ncbi:exported hypothetical protein [Gammaproteobacteria bacterium]